MTTATAQDRVSATAFCSPLMSLMSVVYSDSYASCRNTLRMKLSLMWPMKYIRSLGFIRIWNCLASRKWQKCYPASCIANCSLSNALYICCWESRCLLKKAIGVMTPSISCCSTAPTASDEVSVVSMVATSSMGYASRAMSVRLDGAKGSHSLLCPFQWFFR